MKNLILVLLSITTLSCVKTEAGKTTYSTSSEKAFLIITENTTKDELIKIAAEFKLLRNIDIDFSETTFYKNGKVKNLNLEVDCNDGYKGFAKNFGTTFSINNCGFERDYNEDAEIPWSIGSL
ncbi:hypothetical protein [Tenacibaculum sp. SG-28]|uniref:hypothetical protein n=1 Tax=Tenacibaculum sp. SG-28 TaxID=754426 RepID=UPI000CF463F0|nr:hypothetical protein [Tenacibaculum sp. SG-28]PQJ20609.1 hypothetical protein BSU00_09860 [Tenacibaculum sp. SG-28]